MSVFLRWGIFGILGVAGLMYAYNASKHLAEKRAARISPETAVTAPSAEKDADAEPESAPADVPAAASTAAPQCEEELAVVVRALEARDQGEPLDRLLRIQEIAFKDPPRRARLEKVATLWFDLQGAEPGPDALRVAVISDCEKARNP